MRRVSFWLALLVVGAVLNGTAAADCAQSNVLTVTPAVAEAGAVISVRGESLSTGTCYDDGGCHRDAQRRADGLRLELRLDRTVVDLGDFSPDQD